MQILCHSKLQIKLILENVPKSFKITYIKKRAISYGILLKYLWFLNSGKWL